MAWTCRAARSRALSSSPANQDGTGPDLDLDLDPEPDLDLDPDLDPDPEPELDLEPDLETVVRLAMARLYSEDDSRMRSPTCSASIAAAPSRSSANSV